MVIENNMAAQFTLGEVKRNDSSLSKSLKKVSSGMRINGADDDASGYSISEKMRVRIRALDQDERNVQNGAALLRVAEGGVQRQIDIMKTIKQKVIDADNDTNTDIDRAIIQKEIDQGYQKIEDIAYETTYNGKRLLVGDSIGDKVFGWEVLDEPVPSEGTLGLIKDTNYASLDGEEGPFAVFNEPWPNSNSTGLKNATVGELGLAATNSFSGGKQTAVPHIFSLDLSSYGGVDSLNNKGFRIGSYYFVLTQNTGNNYRYVDNANEIDISGCSSVSEVAAKIKDKVGNVLSSTLTAAVAGSKVTFTGKTAGSSIYYAGTTGSGGEGMSTSYTNGTGKFSSTSNTYLSGGKDAVLADPNDPDVTPSPAKAASRTISLGAVTAGQYITVKGTGTATVQFVEGAGGISGSGDSVTVGKDWVGSGTVAGLTFERKANGDLVLTAPPGASGNNYYVRDGKSTSTGTGVQYTAYTAISGFQKNQDPGITETNHAKLTIDLSSYKNKYNDDLEDFISALKGKLISHSTTSAYYGGTNVSTGDYYYRNYVAYEAEFIDSASNLSAQYLNKYSKGSDIDLNALRSMVNDTTSIAEAFSSLMQSALGSKTTVSVDSSGNLEIAAKQNGTAGNNERLYIHEGQWRSYDIDLNSLFAGGLSIPDDLDMKGFRAYCATDASQWFNFEFVASNALDDKPASGTATLDIKTILIDVKNVTDAASLAQAIYDQATPILAGPDPNYNHHMRIAADTKNGIVTLYDQRQKYVKNREIYDYQQYGAKIADGILDNVVRTTRNIYVKDLVIQHTDHASQNLHVRVPQTTIDHLFGYIPGSRKVEEFNVMTAESREKLLGNKAGTARNGRVVLEDEQGLLDKALEYLTDANTLIGAQISRLGMTQANIITARESTTGSESTIRDADMAKEMTEYMRSNVLLQSSQSMLAQANQTGSQILGLLQ